MSSRTDILVVESSRADPDDDVVDVVVVVVVGARRSLKTFWSVSSSLSALDVVAMK